MLDQANHELKEALGQQFKEFVQKARLEQYGAPSRIPAALKQEIEDVFEVSFRNLLLYLSSKY